MPSEVGQQRGRLGGADLGVSQQQADRGRASAAVRGTEVGSCRQAASTSTASRSLAPAGPPRTPAPQAPSQLVDAGARTQRPDDVVRHRRHGSLPIDDAEIGA